MSSDWMSSDPMSSDGGVIDHHVHLQLIDPTGLGDSLVGVVDLGSGPDLVVDQPGLRVDHAGCFLTAPGGYPSDRTWAPRGSVRPVADATDAALAVSEQKARGASVVKVTLHAGAGPVFDLEVLRAVVAAAAPLPVVAHAEGPGMVELALAGGCDALAHTPWTERLDDHLVTAAAARQKWISTLAIHDGTPGLDIALDNLARFHAAGGQVLYGTDLGNGDLPLGLNQRELDLLALAGLNEDARQSACWHPWPRSREGVPEIG